jgi:hypothetical protein
MKDFTDIAAFLRSCKDLDRFLTEHRFRLVEELSPKVMNEPDKVDYSSEIWVRNDATHYQAVRIDWRGHPKDPPHFHGHRPHFHFETFPIHDFGMYLQGYKRADGTDIPIQKFDTLTGKPSVVHKETHGPIKPAR